MNPLSLWNPALWNPALWNANDQILVWGANVLFQVTLVAAIALAVAAFARRSPALRYWALCASLLLVLFSPVVALVMQRSGKSWLSVSLMHGLAADQERGRGNSPNVEQSLVASRSNPALKNPFDVARAIRSSATDSVDPVAGLDRHDSPAAAAITTNHSSAKTISSQEHSASLAVPTAQHPAATWIGTALRVAMPPLLFVWLVGSILLLIKLVVAWYRLARILSSARGCTRDSLSHLFEQVRRQFHLSHHAELAISPRISTPFAAGVFRPKVVLPECVVDHMSSEQLRNILVHEVAHIARHDQLLVLLQNLVSAIFWLHPLARMLNRQLAQAREEICDNYVLATTNAPSYSRTLLTLCELVQTAHPMAGTVCLLTSRWSLECRVAGILDARRSLVISLSTREKAFVLTISVVMAMLAALTTITVAQNEQNPSVARTVEPDKQTTSTKDATQKPTDGKSQRTSIRGSISDADGKPVAGALVAVVGWSTKPKKGATDSNLQGVALGEATTDPNGKYELRLAEVAPKSIEFANVIARTQDSGLVWQRLDLDGGEKEIHFQLSPQQLIQARLVDIEGQPAAGLSIELSTVTPTNKPGDYLGLARLDQPPKIWPAPVKTDDRGQFSIRNISPGHGVFLKIAGTDRFAPQDLVLNSGASEQRGENDGTYRSLVKNIKPGEVATIPIAPAQFFVGVVRFADTGEPAANARLTIWASQQEVFGSMISVDGKTDAQGRFRLNPNPGIRFGIHAYPPTGAPYQVKKLEDLRWKPGTASQEIEIKLPRGVMARGKIVASDTNSPVSGASVQYIPDRVHNKYVTDDVVTGWQSIQKADEDGNFEISVLPGPGTLLVHGTQGKFVFKEIGSQQVESGKPGGNRYYAHAIQPIDPQPGVEFAELTVKLERGKSITGKLTNEAGAPIQDALVVSRLNISALSPFWRGFPTEARNGRFELGGMAAGEKYLVHFLDPKNRLGATAMLGPDDNDKTIVLLPCGDAKARFVDPKGKPIASAMLGLQHVMTPGKSRYDFYAIQAGELVADEDFASNIDRLNNRKSETNAQGELVFPALIPGASYRFVNMIDGRPRIEKEFVAKSGETFDLGVIELYLNK